MSTKISSFFTAMFAAIFRWMDGSLFFRGLTAALNFVKKICGGSFIAQAFVGEAQPLENSLRRSYFAAFVNIIFNKIPKPVAPPKYWPRGLSNLCRGSWFINAFCHNMDTPIPPPGSRQDVGLGFKAFFQWAFFAAPVFAMGAVIFAAPFLPTMMLGALLVPVFFLLLLSRKFVVDGVTVFILIFIIVSGVVAVFISFTPRQSIQIAVLTAIFMLSAPAVAAAAASRRSVDFFILIFVASAGFTGLAGMFQVLTGQTTGEAYIDTTLFADISFRVESFFGNANVYATYLLIAIPIAAACMVYFKNTFLKLCAIGVTVLLLGNILLTFTRGAYVALPLAVIVFILLMEKRLFILMLAFIPALPIALPLVLPPNIMARLLSIANLSDTSTSFRMAIWQGSIRIIRDFWLSGVGQGIDAYHTVYPYYALAAAGTAHSHNLYLQILVEVGVVGFIIFVAIVACFFKVQINFFRRATEFGQRAMSGAFMSAMVAFLVQSIFDYSFFNYSIRLTFYLFIGLSVAFTQAHKTKNTILEERAAAV